MIRRLIFLTWSCLLLLPALAAAAPPACPAGDDAAGAPMSMPHLAAAIAAGKVDILAIGSASMFGPEASLLPGSVTEQSMRGAASATTPPAQILTQPSPGAFPEQMSRALTDAVPGLKVNVTLRGGRGLSAADQLPLLQDALHGHHFDLVIWQTGTVEAVRNLPPSDFAQTLVSGAEDVTAAGADLVFIDPQFSRFLQTNSNIEPYQQAFQQLAALPGIVLFHRFDLMRNWATDGAIDLERTPKADRTRAVERLHLCLGQQLARLLVASART